MTGRRSAQNPSTRVETRALTASDGVPECAQGCGFTGYASPESTPYTNCGGDPARHVRPPVGAARRVGAALVLALVAVLATAGKCDTAHPKIGSSCAKEGRIATTDGGTRVVCSRGGASNRPLQWRAR